MNYYFDVYFSSMQNFMINTAFNKIHGFCRKNEKQVGIDLPRLMFDDDICDLGNVIRIFGEKNTLKSLTEEKRFNAFLNNVSGVKKTGIKECREGEVYFALKRDRSIDKKKNRQSITHPHLIYEKDNNKVFIYIRRLEKKKEDIFNSFGMLKR